MREVEALAADEKQRAENLMIVDLMRNDLARVSVAGSVEVPELFAVETYPTVHQMVSRITARLRDGVDAIDVLRTIFPCGSVTGAPKIAAIEALARLEPEPRGAYTGSMGWIEPGGDAAFNVLIRTLEWRNGATKARLGLGSGLVVDSIPRDEWAECLLKGDFVRREAQDFDLIETMGFDPERGHCRTGAAPRPDAQCRLPTSISVSTAMPPATSFRRRPSAARQRAMVRLLAVADRGDGDPGQAAMTIPPKCRSRSRFVRCRSIRTTSGCATRPPTAASYDRARQEDRRV